MLLLSILTILACTATIALYGLRVARFGRSSHERLGPSPGSALLPGWLMEAIYWSLHAPGRLLIRLNIEPDTITYASLVLSVLSLPLIAAGHFVYAALVILVGGGLDALDGMVARGRGRESSAGAVLDSFVDRIADAAPFVGMAIFYRDRIVTLVIPLAAMVASSLVSYARAKADIYKLKLPNGLMRRHERIAYLVGSLLLAPVAPNTQLTGTLPYPATLAGIALIAGTGFIAAALLVARTRAALSAPSAAKPETVPAAQATHAATPSR